MLTKPVDAGTANTQPPRLNQPRKPVLIGMATAEIENLLAAMGYPRYRGRQVAEWIYRRHARDYSAMTDLPLALRRHLGDTIPLGYPDVVACTADADGTTKYLLRLADGETVECVRLPYRRWSSVCLSTQAGCPLACAFCATGQGGFARNLTSGEIVAQFLLACSESDRPVTHAVFMGMGEPLLNYDAVLGAARLLNLECGIGARNMTISTVGIVPGIQRLAREHLQINLALSLHAPDDATRASLMPIARRFSLAEVMDAIREYVRLTHRRVTVEYLLIAGINDSVAHADALARLVLQGGSTRDARRAGEERREWGRGGGAPLLAVVNLIPYNETGDGAFRRPTERAVRRFMGRLKQHGVPVTRRLERGNSIAAACGQLRQRRAEQLGPACAGEP